MVRGLDAPCTWVSENAVHSRTACCGKKRRRWGFTLVAESAWTNDTDERVMREMLWALQATLEEQGKPLEEWITVVPAAQWALNTAWTPCIGPATFKAMVGREPQRGCAALVEEADGG